MSIFGWSYPAGCNSVPGDEDEGPCQVCGRLDCVCPECPVCGETGNPQCYDLVAEAERWRYLPQSVFHVLLTSPEQDEGRERMQKILKEENRREAEYWREHIFDDLI